MAIRDNSFEEEDRTTDAYDDLDIDEKIDFIEDLDFQESLLKKASVPNTLSNELDYEELDVTEESGRGGELRYEISFTDSNTLEIKYRHSDKSRNIYMIEALSRGMDAKNAEKIYEGDSYNQARDYFSDLPELIEDRGGKSFLAEEYQEPLNNFLSEFIWK